MINQFSRLITLLRQEKGISQKAAAAELGISHALLSHYERGIRECGLDFVIKCADFYGVSADYLLGRTPERNGAVIEVQELPDENVRFGGSGAKGSILPVLNKKLVFNSLNIVFDMLQESRSKELTAEASKQIMLSVYKVFRFLYELNGDNPSSLFAAESEAFTERVNSAALLSDIRLKGLCGTAKVKIKKADIDTAVFALNQAEIEKKYPLFASSLFNLLHTAEKSMGIKSEKQ